MKNHIFRLFCFLLCILTLSTCLGYATPEELLARNVQFQNVLGYRYIRYTADRVVYAYNSPEDEEMQRQFREKFPDYTLEFIGMTLQDKLDRDLFAAQTEEQARSTWFGEMYDFDIYYAFDVYPAQDNDRYVVAVYGDPNHIDFIASDFQWLVTDDPRFQVVKDPNLEQAHDDPNLNVDKDVAEATPDSDL